MDTVTAYQNAMKTLWTSLVPTNPWNPKFGLEGAWMDNYNDWGYPLEAIEVSVLVNGKTYNGRHFHKVGLVVWDPSTGAVVVGKP